MTKYEEMLAMINAFIAPENRSVSEHGSRARVANTDISDLREIVTALMEFRYERDVSGMLPVDVHMVDRTRYEGVSISYIKHLPGDGDHESYEKALMFNLRSANSAVQHAASKLDMATFQLNDFYSAPRSK